MLQLDHAGSRRRRSGQVSLAATVVEARRPVAGIAGKNRGEAPVGVGGRADNLYSCARSRAGGPWSMAPQPIVTSHSVSLVGRIAAGKTTLAQALQQGGLFASFEAFQENPFWSAFYNDPVHNAFEAEISFLLQHYHQIKLVGRSLTGVLVCDYSLLLDQAYAWTTLAADEVPAFLSVYSLVTKRLAPPILIVHLRCDADEEFSRIARRGREVERTATLDLLVRLNAAIEGQLAAPDLDVPILRINSDRVDFTEQGPDRQEIVAEIRSRLSAVCNTDRALR